jgi:hypothetical protein
MNAGCLCFGVRACDTFQRSNQLTYYYETWCECYASESHHTVADARTFVVEAKLAQMNIEAWNDVS